MSLSETSSIRDLPGAPSKIRPAVGSRRNRTRFLLLALAALAGCRAQHLANDNLVPISWVDQVGPLLQQRCSPCHAGPKAAAGYDTTTYVTAIGARGRAGKPALVAPPPDAVQSLLLAKVAPSTTSSAHLAVTDTFPTLRAWVVDGAVALRHGGVHEPGIDNPTDAHFHGKLLRGLKYDLAVCADCHGADLKGGGAKVSCTTCHEGGPTACTTCHGQPPTTGPYAGAHQAHTAGAGLDKPLACSACHKVPSVWNESGHLLDADGNPKTRATVLFGVVAALPTLKRVNPPTYNPATLTCSSVYCHGGAFDDAKATHQAPVWTEGAAGAACGSCHGLPPANHGDNAQDCVDCHAQVVGAGKALLRPASLHVDGQVQVKDGIVQVSDGSGTVSCTACHGQPPASGAHLAHLYPSRFTTAPVACAACHTVPQKVGSDGHIHAAPGRLAFSGTAIANVVTSPLPAWDASAGTCSNVYCHGGGDRASHDSTPLLRRQPAWAGGAAEVACGSCHGLPPNDPAHATSTPGGAITGIQDCYKCHYDTIRPDGGFKDPSLHVNGDPNVKKVPNVP